MVGEMTFLAALPAGYDERTRMALTEGNQVIVTHPEHPPLVLDAKGQWQRLGAEKLHQAAASAIPQP